MAQGGETCSEACEAMNATCDLGAIQDAASDVSVCKAMIESVGYAPSKGGRYPDDNSGCTYHPGQTGWYQLMDNGKDTTCEARNADKSRRRVCFCQVETEPAETIGCTLHSSH